VYAGDPRNHGIHAWRAGSVGRFRGHRSDLPWPQRIGQLAMEDDTAVCLSMNATLEEVLAGGH
jgi:hypothetical protein